MRRSVLLAAFLALLAAAPARAHLTPNSTVSFDVGRTYAVAEIVIPTGELGYAVGRPVGVPAGEGDVAAPAGLGDYLMARMAVTAPDGRPWTLRLRDLAIDRQGPQPDLVAHVVLRPPAGAGTRRFDLAYSAVIDRVANHFVLVFVKSDFDAGRLSDHPRLIGGLQRGAFALRVDRGPASAWRGFLSAIGLGMRHIAEGHDHLLFLLALLMPAPLVARAGRWREFGGLRFTVGRLAGVVTAFTLGHSLTLIGGAWLGWRLPTQPVEVMIAVSILVSSVHAWRPLFAGREPLVAGGFGLIHGMAFATLIGRFGLEPWQKALSILGFNLGIEVVQLGVVALVLPALVLLARTRSYPVIRTCGAAFAGVSAIAWILERVTGSPNPVGRIIDAGLAHAPWLLAALVLGTAAAVFADRSRPAAISYE